MKRTVFTSAAASVIALYFLCIFSACELKAQPIFWQEDRNLSVDAGYKHASLNCGTFDVAFIEATMYFNPTLGWEFFTKFEYGKDYFSFSPLSLVGLPFWIYSATHGGEATSNLVGALAAISTARLPIYVWDWFEVSPYWDLFKLTKIYDSKKLKINADVGLQLKFYPLCSSYSLSTLYISPFVQYDFAYKKNAGNFYSESWAGNIKRTDKSLFFGYSYGVTIGYYF